MFTVKKSIVAAFAALTLVAAAGPVSAKPFPKKPFPHPHHWGYGLGVGLGLGMLGAAIATSASDCSIVRQPVTDVDGNLIGYTNVRVCE